MDIPRIIQPVEFVDHRGTFSEIFNAAKWEEQGIRFVTENFAWSRENVFRGLHYQTVNPQGKLLSVVHGVILDITVDVREGSFLFGENYWYALSGSLRQQLWIPPGFAHGYQVLSEYAAVIYLATQYRHEESEVVIRYDDPALGLQVPDRVIVSEKDRNGILLADAPRVKV
jgi:dTDP-4-dehydrorhamnose 3,5-epimerase